jgi:hypothetical protein
MTQEEIHTTLDKMLEDPKAKTFLNHLVRAYMPITQVQKVWDKPQGIFKCVISRDELISTQEILQGIQTEEFKESFMTSLKGMFDEKSDNTSPMIKLIGDKKMGVTGKDTTTFMSYPVAQEFYNWVITKSLKGDKHINWLLGSIRRASFIERAEKINDSTVQKKVDAFKKATVKTASFAMGDSSDALSKLKAQMEANGN